MAGGSVGFFKLMKNYLLLAAMTLLSTSALAKDPVDYVNPYMGNISHVLKPTYPTVQLPNSLMRVFPRRADFADLQIEGLPLMVWAHRNQGASGLEILVQDDFSFDEALYPKKYFYDREEIRPYSMKTFLEGENVAAEFAPSFKSALYKFDFSESKKARRIIRLFTNSRSARASGDALYLSEALPRGVKLHIAMRFDKKPEKVEVSPDAKSLIAVFGAGESTVCAKYGVSFISPEKALENLEREIPDFDISKLFERGRKLWNEKLSKIRVEGSERDLELFYTCLWRNFERMVDFSEYGEHYNPFDGKVHKSDAPFYADDWIWDTHLTSHPLRVLIDPKVEADMLNSYIAMAEASQQKWLPTFPQIWGDSHAMNGNHAIPTFLDACRKGLEGVDYAAAYKLALNTLETETITPWCRAPANELDEFYKKRGYFPALREGERETVADVNKFEKRQSVAVTLGACYDDWALSQLAKLNGDEENFKKYSARAKNYKNLWKPDTQFFHPKDMAGKFIEPFDYRFAGGLGFRNYYDENNAYTYRWYLAFDAEGLVELMGGPENFEKNLDELFVAPLGTSRTAFHANHGPDQTGNIGQFAMGNEPSFHIPYLYNYAGKAWKTQKFTRLVCDMWFKNNLLGIPGDEDGGAMSGFVVFTMLGIYPTAPGRPEYDITGPYFKESTLDLGGGKTFKIAAKNASAKNKYIQSAKLNGKPHNSAKISHSDIASGGVLEFEMGEKPNKNWPAAN